MSDLIDTVRIIDSDTHLSEPADLWTSRMSAKKWGDLIPHVVVDEPTGHRAWAIGGEPTFSFHGGKPEGRALDEMRRLGYPVSSLEDPGGWDSHARLKWMDKHGIYAHVLYSNLTLFGSGSTHQAAVAGEALQLECIKVYNDFQTEWASADPKRLLPMTQLPFWDLDESIREMQRCTTNGHHGIVFSQEPASFGLPPLVDPHWDRLWAATQEAGLAVNFHVGTGSPVGKPSNTSQTSRETPSDPSSPKSFAKKVLLSAPADNPVMSVANSVGIISGNIHTFSHLITGGICDRFPKLKFVGVESGIGWIPFFLEAMDWQWRNHGVATKVYDLLPSEYFKRQMYACFWFEDPVAHAAIELVGADNFLYETDFPHPTCMCPGPDTTAQSPAQWLRDRWLDVPEDSLRKVLHDNAARIYGL